MLSSDDDGEAEGQDKGGSEEGRDVRRGSNRGGGGGGTTEPSNSLSGDIADDMLVVESTQEDEDYSWSRVPVQLSMMPPPSPPQLLCSTAPAANVSSRETTPNGDNGAIDLTATPSPWGAQENSAQDCRSKVAGSPVEGQRTSEAENPLLDGPVLEATEPPEKGHGAVEMADAAEEVQEADPVELGHSEGEVDTVLEEDWWPVALEDDSLPPGVASYVPGRPSLSDTLREAEARLMIGEGKEGAESAGPRGSRGLLRRLARVLEDSPWALAQAASVAAGGLSEPMGRRGRDERAEGTGGSVEGSGLPCDSPAGGVGPAEDPKILKGGGQPSGDDGPQDLQPESTTPPFEGPSHSPRPPCAGPNPWGPGEGHGEPTVYDPSGTNAISSPQKSICRDLCPEKVWEIPMTQDDVPLAARRVPGGARGAVAMTQDDIPLAERQPHGPKVPWSVRCPKPKARGGQAPRSVETAGPGGTQGSGDMKDDIPLLQRKAMIRCPLRCPTASSLEADTPLSATMKSRGCGGSPLGPSGQAGASIPPGNAGVRDEAAGSRATPHCPSPRGDGSDDTSEDVDVPFIKRCRNFWAPSPPLLGKDIRGQGIGLSLAEMETHGSSPTDPAGGGFQDEDDIPFVKRCKEPRASSAPLHSFVQGSVNGRRYFSKDERKPVGRGSESPTLSQDVDVPLARKTRRRLLPDASPLEDGEAFYPLELPCSGRVMSKQLQSPTERAVALSQEADVLLVERARQLTAGVSPFAGAKEVRPSELQVGAQEAPRGHTCPAERPVDLSQEADIPLAERARHRQWAGVSTTWLATGHVFPLGRAGGAQGSSRRPCSPATGAMNLSQEADMPLAKRARQSLQTGVAWCSRQDSEAPFSSLGPIGAHTVSGGLNSSAEEQRDLSQEADVPLANRVSKLRACEGADSARPAVVSGCAREPTRGLDQPAEGAMGLSRQADIPPAKRMRQPWGDWNSFENREAAHSCEEVVDASQEIGTPLSELSRDLMADGSAEANAEMQDAMHREERLKDLKTAELTRRFWHERAAGPVNLSQKPGSPLSERRKHQREGGTAAGEMGVVFRPSEADTRLNERCRNLCNPNRLAFRPEDVSPSWKERTAWERPTSMARSLEEGNPGDTSRGAPGAMGLPLQLIASPEAKRPKEGTGRLPLEVPPSSPIPSIRDVGAASPDLEGGGGFGAHEETPPVPETPQEVPDTSQESQGMMASALDGPVCLSMPFRQADDHMGAGGGERPPTPPGTLDNGGEGVRQGAFAAPSEVFGDLEHAQDDREDRPSASSPSGSSGCGLMDLWGQGICGLSGGCISQPTQPRPNPDPQPQAMALERDGPCTAPAQDGEDGGRVAFDPEGFALPTPRRPGPRQVCPKSPGLGCTGQSLLPSPLPSELCDIYTSCLLPVSLLSLSLGLEKACW